MRRARGCARKNRPRRRRVASREDPPSRAKMRSRPRMPRPPAHPGLRPRRRRVVPRGAGPQAPSPRPRRASSADSREPFLGASNRCRPCGLGVFRLAAPAAILAVAALLAGACGRISAGRIADRLLRDYRVKSGLRPLPAAGSIRVRLSPAGGEGVGAGASGLVEIEWEGTRYRETITSAGVSTVRGIQGGKAFYIDEDGVTRVGSEPMLAELLTRSYFWRRAYLFDDRERAKLALGPADASGLAISLRPLGGNDLGLGFDRDARRCAARRRRASTSSSRARRDSGTSRDCPSRERSCGRACRRGVCPIRPSAAGTASSRSPSRRQRSTRSRRASSYRQPSRANRRVSRSTRTRRDPCASRRSSRIAPASRDVGTSSGGSSPTASRSRSARSRCRASTSRSAKRPRVSTRSPAACSRARRSSRSIRAPAACASTTRPAGSTPEGFGRNAVDDDGNIPAAILFRAGRRLRLRAGVTTKSPLLSRVTNGRGARPRAGRRGALRARLGDAAPAFHSDTDSERGLRRRLGRRRRDRRAAAAPIPRVPRSAAPLDLREAARRLNGASARPERAIALEEARACERGEDRAHREEDAERKLASRRLPRLRAISGEADDAARERREEHREQTRRRPPRNAPIIASILTSPSPIPSSRRDLLVDESERDRARPRRPRRRASACSGVRSRVKNESTRPTAMPGQRDHVRQDLERRRRSTASARHAEERSAPEAKSPEDGARRKTRAHRTPFASSTSG